MTWYPHSLGTLCPQLLQLIDEMFLIVYIPTIYIYWRGVAGSQGFKGSTSWEHGQGGYSLLGPQMGFQTSLSIYGIIAGNSGLDMEDAISYPGGAKDSN